MNASACSVSAIFAAVGRARDDLAEDAIGLAHRYLQQRVRCAHIPKRAPRRTRRRRDARPRAARRGKRASRCADRDHAAAVIAARLRHRARPARDREHARRVAQSERAIDFALQRGDESVVGPVERGRLAQSAREQRQQLAIRRRASREEPAREETAEQRLAFAARHEVAEAAHRNARRAARDRERHARDGRMGRSRRAPSPPPARARASSRAAASAGAARTRPSRAARSGRNPLRFRRDTRPSSKAIREAGAEHRKRGAERPGERVRERSPRRRAPTRCPGDRARRRRASAAASESRDATEPLRRSAATSDGNTASAPSCDLVARVDTGEERRDERVARLAAEAPRRELRDRLAASRRRAARTARRAGAACRRGVSSGVRANASAPIGTGTSAPPRTRKRSRLAGAAAIGKRVESVIAQEGGHRRRDAERVGTALDEMPVDALAPRAPPARAAASSTTTVATARGAARRRGEAGDAARRSTATLDVRVSSPREHCASGVAAVKARTPSTGVSGRQPWPRFSTWPRAARPAAAQVAHPAGDRVGRRGERARIEVALQRGAPADVSRGGREVHAPVEREHVGAGFEHRVEHVRAAVHVEDQRRAVAVRAAARSRGASAGSTRGSRRRRAGPAQVSKSCTACAPASICAFRYVDGHLGEPLEQRAQQRRARGTSSA